MAYSNPTATSSTPPSKKFKPKEHTVDKIFADLVLAAPTSGFVGPWMVRAEHTADSGCAYRWGEHCWEFVHGEEGRSMAAKWLDKAHPDKASSDKAKQAWNFACDRLRQEKPFTEGDYRHMNIIPTLSGYLSLLEDGTIEVLKADPIYGVDYVIEAKLSHEGVNSYYQPQPASISVRPFGNPGIPCRTRLIPRSRADDRDNFIGATRFAAHHRTDAGSYRPIRV